MIYTRRLVSVSLQRVVSFHDEHLVSSIAYKLSTAVNPHFTDEEAESDRSSLPSAPCTANGRAGTPHKLTSQPRHDRL